MVITRGKALTKREHEARKAVLKTCCSDLQDALNGNSSGRKPYGMVSQMVKELKSSCPWISRDMINYAYKMFLNSKKKTQRI